MEETLTMSVTMAQALLGVSRRTVYRWLEEGKLKSLDPNDVRALIVNEYKKSLETKNEPVPISTPAWQAPPLEIEPDLISPTDSVEELLNNLPDSGGKWFK